MDKRAPSMVDLDASRLNGKNVMLYIRPRRGGFSAPQLGLTGDAGLGGGTFRRAETTLESGSFYHMEYTVSYSMGPNLTLPLPVR